MIETPTPQQVRDQSARFAGTVTLLRAALANSRLDAAVSTISRSALNHKPCGQAIIYVRNDHGVRPTTNRTIRSGRAEVPLAMQRRNIVPSADGPRAPLSKLASSKPSRSRVLAVATAFPAT